ncbi:Hypothetical_protein [Hexamita inflata]|uniref:Hypothetical_protein n=1 Tax=Hexamita inflata TaxID=28002 RepID=A0AA86Q6P8_9EUKA|nr:Hypothetical protein HINF_LOCUS34675 [Hexamita inflata]
MNKHSEAAFQNESVPTQQYLLKQGKGNKEIKIMNPDLQKRVDKNANFSVKNFIQLKGEHAMKTHATTMKSIRKNPSIQQVFEANQNIIQESAKRRESKYSPVQNL